MLNMVSVQNNSDLEYISRIFNALERVRDRTTDMMERMFSMRDTYEETTETEAAEESPEAAPEALQLEREVIPAPTNKKNSRRRRS